MRARPRPMAQTRVSLAAQARAGAERWSNVLVAAGWAVLIATMYAGLLTVH